VVKVFAHLNAATSVGILTWLYNPKILSKFGKVVKYCFFLVILSLMEKSLKLVELWIVESFLNMEGEWEVLMVFLSNGFIVDLHVVVDGFFVTKVIVIFHFTVLNATMGRYIFFFLFFLFLAFLPSPDDFAVLGGAVVGCS
jgi:hypothetical protein